MNKRLHRLVFDRRRGMRLAVAETARACCKGMGAAALVVALPAAAQTRPPVVFASSLAAPRYNLPQPYGTLNGAGGSPINSTPRPFVYAPGQGPSIDLARTGAVSFTVNGKNATFNQGAVDRVVINWDSFDIGAGYSVHFTQNTDPTRYVSALNRIWSADPSVILGSLTADREVILLNANGVYFGRGARVDTGKFVATANSIADSVFEKGLRNVTDGSAVFSTAGTDYLPTRLDSAISLEQGAEIRSAAGGDVLLVAPRVSNQGRIETPQGQTVLAAGDKVYLMSSSDPRQRGLIVAVDPVKAGDGITNDPQLGIAENAATGSYKTVNGATVPDATPDNTAGLVTQINEIRATSGTVNLVGLTVRQNGQINATTAVKGANGAIFLQSMTSTVALPGDPTAVGGAATRGVLTEPGSTVRFGSGLGTVQIGAGSLTAVQPDASTATQIDAEVFNPSLIRAEGAAIAVAGGAKIVAPAGKIELFASQSADNNPIFFSGQDGTGLADTSRVVIAPGALISAAGIPDVPVDGARNQGSQRLFRIELADVPVQRTGPLYRSQVVFDQRDAAQVAVANVTGASAAIGRTAAERSTVGGSVSVQTDGALVVGDGATLDVSGGSVLYAATKLQSSVLSQNGRLVSFNKAKPGETVDALLSTTQTTVVPAYTEGADGGSLLLSGRQVALAGQIHGQTTLGDLQRTGLSAAAAPASLTIGQRGGSAYYLDSLVLSPDAAPVIDPGVFQNPLQSTLPGLANELSLSLPMVSVGGFGNLALRAAKLSQPAYGSLDLGNLGNLDIQADTISLNGTFSAAGGSISVVSPNVSATADITGLGDIRLSAASRLDVAGRWANDTAGAQGGASNVPAQADSGNLTLNASHSLLLAPGATLDVSGGAHLAADGTLTKGNAGSLTLATGTSVLNHPTLSLAGAVLRGYDFGKGGTLVLGAPELTIGDSTAPGFGLSADFFSASGFGTIRVDTQGDIRLASGTQLAPTLLNWQFTDDYRSRASDGFTPAVATAQSVDPRLAVRSAVSLALAGQRPLAFGASNLTVERGASIQVEPGGSLSLSGTGNVTVGATGGLPGQASVLSAPGGTITLAITGNRGNGPDRDPTGFDGTQAVWLGADARVSVDGVAQLRPDGAAPALAQFGSGGTTTPLAQRQVGTVLGGGTINLSAARGYVIADAGSAMSLNGASATLNFPGLTAAVPVAKSAGALNVSSPEGFVLDGSVSARAPRDATGRATADGGQLSLSVGVGGVTGDIGTDGTPYPTSPRTVSIGTYEGLMAARGAVLGSDLGLTLGDGTGFVRTSMLQAAGFAAFQFGAGDAIRWDTSLALNAPLSLQFNAPALAAAPGVKVSLTTGYARLGDTTATHQGGTPNTQASADLSPLHDTQLRLTAGTIDVYGNVGLQGFSTVSLDASATPQGEIRFSAVGPAFGFVDTLRRGLNFAGLLSLTAGQAYATSATQYTLRGLAATGPDDSGSQLVLRPSAGGTPANLPLSAFGSLTINATDIDQGGILRQPFGQITLQAERSLTLGDGSITSVSGNGASLLFGQTLNLADWYPSGPPISFSQLPLSKGISLSAATLTTAPTASLSAAGGGLLRAWEFFPGIGGSSDYFQTAGLYAVLPDDSNTQATALAGGLLASGQVRQIEITMPGSGLTPGRYTLMPARLALLAGDLPSGAFLVSRASDQGKTVLRAPILQDDGSVVITGYLTSTGSATVGTPGERFVVEPASTFMAKSDIRLSDVSQLLADRATTLGQSQPALPRDGGLVQIHAAGTQRSLWQAALDLSAHGGQAGLLDVAATQVALVDDLEKTPDGALGISAQVVAQSGAGSVLLGGRRSLDASTSSLASPTWNIDASGTVAVSVDLGTTAVKTEELVLAATDRVSLADGTQISAPGRGTLGARTLGLAGDGVLAAISANPLQVQRSGVTLAGGDLNIGANSRLSGPQVSLDATGSMTLASSARVQAPSVSVAARVLAVGEAEPTDPDHPGGAAATALTGSLLEALRGAPSLSLLGYQRIDFIGNQNWSQRPDPSAIQPDPAAAVVQQSLVLDTPLLRGLNGADGTTARTDITAQDLIVRNTTGYAAVAIGAGQGSLLLQALPPVRYGQTGGITFGPGDLSLGYAQASLRSSGDLVWQGTGSTTAQQDLALSATRLTAATGASQSVSATGVLAIGTEAGGRTLGERVGVGADIRLSANSIVQNGQIDLPGGQISLQAGGTSSDGVAISFGGGSSVSVAGFSVSGPGGFTTDGTAGRIQASAAQGRIEVLGTLDASAARRSDGTQGEGDAGSITLLAAGNGGQLVLSRAGAYGALRGAAGSAVGDQGGKLTVDVDSMSSADALAGASGAGGLTGQFSLRVRHGDVALDQSVAAQTIALAADGGRLSIGANGAPTLDASAPAGGVVQLAAGQDLVLGASTRIDARSTRAGTPGGDVLLSSTNGRVRLAAGTQVDATGGDPGDGRIVLRAPRDDSQGTVAIDPIQTSKLMAGEVDLEAVRVYTQVTRLAAAPDGDPGTLAQSTVRSDNNAFMASQANVLASLGVSSAESGSGRVSLRAGVEVRSDGDLTLADDWVFAGTMVQPNRDRPGGDAGFLTLRAAGSLWVSGTLSDGFTPAGALSSNAHSWSYRLVAGADLQAANPLAVRDLSRGSEETGNLTLDAGKMVRTGAGSIELAAGRDVIFGGGGDPDTPSALAYVAGRRLAGSDALLATLFQGQLATPTFAQQGGRLDVQAARDVVAPEATQLVGNWLWRSGLLSTRPQEAGLYSATSQLAWWTQYATFNQTLGSFGGGNLSVAAGRDILNLQAMAPTAGWADSRTAANATIHTLNGGDVSIAAGRDLLGGQFLLGRGQGRLLAGGAVGAAMQDQQLQLPVLTLLDGQWRVNARNDVQVLGAFDPTAIAASSGQNRAGLSPYFYTWGALAGVRLGSNAGTASLGAGVGEDQIRAYGLDADATNVGTSFQVLPPSLQIMAGAGDVNLDGLGAAVMYPSANGQLRLWAGTDVRLGSTGNVQLAMSDSAPSDWAPPSAPVPRIDNRITVSLVPNTLADLVPLTGLHATDPYPVQIHAEGSLQITGASLQASTLLLPKSAELSAGLDVIGLSLRAQNLASSDSTRVQAGRNVLAGVYGNVEAAGPGRLEVSAGGGVDLGASGGLSTTGNLRNAGLPAQGAAIRVTASTTGTMDVASFNSTYLQPASIGGSPRYQQFRDALVSYVGAALKISGLSFEQAWAYFKGFPPMAQAALGQQVLAAEFAAIYLVQPAPTATDLSATLSAAFDLHKTQLLQAGEQALAAGTTLTLPGREVLQGDALRTYLASIRSLSFAGLDLETTVASRVAALAAVQSGWRDAVAASLGGTAAGFAMRAASNPQDSGVLAFNAALTQFNGPTFDNYRQQVLASEAASTGATASQFGRLSLPMRLALFDQGFRAAELSGAGSFVNQPYWSGVTPVFSYAGSMDLTQSSILTERGGNISLVNAGGPINVGLKDTSGGTATPKGVIALGGGDIFGYAKGDFQVNTQRVFIVGAGNMNLWSSSGDIDSGRGANTAVAAPPLTARPSVDGIAFEVPATTTGSGLGILPDAKGRLDGTIGLYPALGEILALDAFIRAPSVVLGSTVKGADNLISASVGGAAAPVSAPSLSVAAPPPSNDSRARAAPLDGQTQESRGTNALLTVELLGLGAAPEAESCEEKQRVNGKCPEPAKK